MVMKYQLVVLGPNAARYSDLLAGPMEERLRALGLNPSADLQVLREADFGAVNWKGNPVGLWFGGTGAASTDELGRLIARKAPVLPLVEDLTDYPKKTPPLLHPINARKWDDERVPGDVLRVLRLTRDLRQAFISYKRVESQAVANGFFEALSHRGYRVFLDTASVEAAEPFQDILWDRLADMDLMVLLDSPTALNSRWVNEELTRVNQLGLGVLQLVWPNHKPYAGTELSERRDLTDADFEGGAARPGAELTRAALAQVVRDAEWVRIRSLAARRTRVVHELVARAVGKGLAVQVQPSGPLTIRRPTGGTVVGLALPLIGLPDAWSIHQAEKDLRKLREREDAADLKAVESLLKRDGVRLVYDGLGVQAERGEFLVWLNDQLRLRTMSLDRAGGQSANPVDQWLAGLPDRDPRKEEV
jgi:Fe2+ transport system protein FeoA